MIKKKCFFLICFFSTALFGQITSHPLKLDSSFQRDYFSVNIQPFLSSKFQFQHNGSNLLQSKHLLSGEIGIGYKRQLNRKWICYSSINIGLLPYNFTFNFESPKNSIFQTGPFKEDYTRLDFNWSEYSYIRLYSTIDLLFSRQIYSNSRNNNQFFIGGGLKTFVFFIDEFQYEYSSTWYIDETNPNVNLFYADINDTTSNRVKFSVQAEVSYIRALNKGREISTTLLFNYSPFKNVEGYYYFSNLGFASSGTFKQSLTYLGVRLNYFIRVKGKKNINLIEKLKML